MDKQVGVFVGSGLLLFECCYHPRVLDHDIEQGLHKLLDGVNIPQLQHKGFLEAVLACNSGDNTEVKLVEGSNLYFRVQITYTGGT